MKCPRMVSLAACLILLSLGLLGSRPLRARVYVEVHSPSREPFPLALPPFRVQGKTDPSLAAALTRVVHDDLLLTGYFRLLDPAAFVEDPVKAGIRPGQFSFSSWQQIDALGLVKGALLKRDGALEAEFHIYDVLGRVQIGGKLYRGKEDALRRLGHRIAGEIVRAYTGEPGFFLSRIAAVSTAAGNKQVVIMDVSGNEKLVISNNPSINLLPAWSPRGLKLAYTSFMRGNSDLYMADLVRGLTERVSAYPGLNVGAAWAPDGRSMAVTLSKDGDPELYLINLRGRILKRLTRSYGVDSSPSWSPDGRRLAFVSSRGGGAQIYVMNRDGTGVRRLTFAGSENVSPAWSPKGDRIAFAGRDRGAFDIFVMNADGSGLIRLTQNQGDNEDPSWSPDGNFLVFSSTRAGGSSQLYVSSADGLSQVRITSGPGEYTNPDWSPILKW